MRPDSFQWCGDWMRSNSIKPEHRKFHTNMKENLFTVRVTEDWNRLPIEAVE